MLFQSTLRRTERLCWHSVDFGLGIFQSTLRRTERPSQSSLSSAPSNFNPRSDERSDVTNANSGGITSEISIHAPTNGAMSAVTVNDNCLLFQSTLRRTERQLVSHIPIVFRDFNPRSDERSDHIIRHIITHKHYFNPRSDERSDDFIVCATVILFNFNPRSDERSDGKEI